MRRYFRKAIFNHFLKNIHLSIMKRNKNENDFFAVTCNVYKYFSYIGYLNLMINILPPIVQNYVFYFKIMV